MLVFSIARHSVTFPSLVNSLNVIVLHYKLLEKVWEHGLHSCIILVKFDLVSKVDHVVDDAVQRRPMRAYWSLLSSVVYKCRLRLAMV